MNNLTHKLTSITTIACLVLSCLWFSVVEASDPRVVIHIFKYGELEDPKKRERFSEFKDILRAKISTISDELSGPSGGLSELARLAPFFIVDGNSNHVVFSGNNADLSRRWSRANALEILSGRIRDTGVNFSVKSRVFFGELDTGLGSRFLTIELPIIDEEYDTTRDSHSVAILYALALDSMQRCQPEDKTMLLLSAAYERLADLPQDLPGMEK